MASNVRTFSDMVRKDVFTTKGHYAGKVLDVGLDLEKYRVKSIIVDAVRGSFLANMVGDKKGVIVPYSMVQSVGDIIIIKHVNPAPVESDILEENQTA